MSTKAICDGKGGKRNNQSAEITQQPIEWGRGVKKRHMLPSGSEICWWFWKKWRFSWLGGGCGSLEERWGENHWNGVWASYETQNCRGGRWGTPSTDSKSPNFRLTSSGFERDSTRGWTFSEMGFFDSMSDFFGNGIFLEIFPRYGRHGMRK